MNVDLNVDEKKNFDLVARRLLAGLSPDALAILQQLWLMLSPKREWIYQMLL